MKAQYWLWGQSFDFGYYSKPPLIAWVIGAVTTLAGSDAPFWVRAPGSVFHGATALILAALAARLHGRAAAVWTAATYATLPMVAVGSLLISTDTVMAPFFAAALYFHTRLAETHAAALCASGRARWRACAFLGKIRRGLFPAGGRTWGAAGSRAADRPGATALPCWRAFAVVILPNIVWNATNGLATASHILDNVGWVRDEAPLGTLNPGGLAEFFLAQFAVFGPLLFAALLWAAARRARTAPSGLCGAAAGHRLRAGVSRPCLCELGGGRLFRGHGACCRPADPPARAGLSRRWS